MRSQLDNVILRAKVAMMWFVGNLSALVNTRVNRLVATHACPPPHLHINTLMIDDPNLKP